MQHFKTLPNAAQAVLQASAYAELRELRVETAEPRRLVLHGAVHSFYHKQLAQELLRNLAIENGYIIVNRLDVMDVPSASTR